MDQNPKWIKTRKIDQNDQNPRNLLKKIIKIQKIGSKSNQQNCIKIQNGSK